VKRWVRRRKKWLGREGVGGFGRMMMVVVSGWSWSSMDLRRVVVVAVKVVVVGCYCCLDLVILMVLCGYCCHYHRYMVP
jgi:hypothetical protein